MPYNTFTPNTTIQSSKINENFANAVHKSDVQVIANKIPVLSVITSNSGTFDLSTGNWFVRTLDGTNLTLALANVQVGQCFAIELIQGGAGTNLATWFSGITWVRDNTAVTLKTTVGLKDVIGFRCTGVGAYDAYIMG